MSGFGIVLGVLLCYQSLTSGHPLISKSEELCRKFSRKSCDSGTNHADSKEIQHAALVGFKWAREQGRGPIHWMCTGSLVSDRYVLTTRNCIWPIFHCVANFWVRLGENEVHEVAQVLFHPEANSDSSDEVIHDVALLELKDVVTLSDSVRPICLQSESDLALTEARFYSWILSFEGDGDQNPGQLHKFNVTVIPIDDCKNTLNTSSVNDNNMICALDLNPSYRCEVERWSQTGSALQIPNEEVPCTNVQVGMVSIMTETCRFKDVLPIGFTRMSHNLAWIESIL